MPKKPDTFNPGEHFTRVGMQPGQVQQDSDWNRGGARESRRRPGRVTQDSDWNSRGGRRLWHWLILAGGVMIVLAGGAAVFLVLRIPPVASQVPTAPMIVTLSKPINGSSVAAGSGVPVSAQVVASHPVVSVELWADSLVVAQAAPSPLGIDAYAASLSWAPSVGSHVLVVRATDDQGHTGLSNVVRLDGLVATDSMAMRSYVAQGGETLGVVERASGSTISDILAYNRGLSDGQPLEAGQELLIPIPSHYDAPETVPPPAGSLPEGIEPASRGPSPLELWLQARFSPATGTLPAAPVLMAAARGCDAVMSITDNSNAERGFFLYRLGPADSAFERIATLGPHDGQGSFGYEDTHRSGSNSYYAAAFNTVGESPGPLAQVVLPTDGCGASTWSGSVRLSGSMMISPIAADRAYFYVSVNGGQWKRVPSNPETFLPAVQGGFDVSNFLPDLSGDDGGPINALSLDGWGWDGGSLVSLGQGDLNASSQTTTVDLVDLSQWTALQGSANTQVVSDPSSNKPLYFSEEVIFSKAADFVFRWKTGSSEAGSGRWEVSRSPYFPPSSILAEGVAGLLPGKEGYSYFNIPFDDILALKANVGQQPAVPLVKGPVAFGSEETLNLGVGQSVLLGQPNIPGDASESSAGGAVTFNNPTSVGAGVENEYYVRLTPMMGNQIAGGVSNTVIARYDPEATQPTVEIPTLGPEYYTPLYEIQILDYTPGAIEAPGNWGCVKVVKVILGSAAAQSGYSADHVGDKICPYPYTGEGYQGWKGVKNDLEKLGSWFKKGLDWAAKGWDDIKAFAIKTLMKVTGVQAVCDLAEGAVLPEDACYDVIDAAVNVGLASMGIPPTIPNFDKLMDQGLDYAVELAVQEALEKVPACVGPCEQAVKDKIREALEAGIAAVANQSVAPSCVSEDEAHANGAEPWCPPDGLVVRPVLGAVDSPPTILVRLTRRPDVPDPTNVPTCMLNVDAVYTLPAGGWTKDNPQFSASPFSGGGSLIIPSLSPGESIKVAVALNKPNPVSFPWESYIGDPSYLRNWGSMVWYGTSHATAGASFVVTGSYAGNPPAPCGPGVISEEVGPQQKGWKLK